ncbi:TlpA family protein disulfide reductase [Microbispora triticiradicis]|uniref:Thioredoxin domain-containing protein n=3 Tax=Microbispora TaxID=2005 RepID=A0ABY3LYF1_9ACTN|nr:MULTISPECIES: hypothetical protein [Microbispora]TLP55162.1 hypothetical protein FED44_25890 [Microbispora fusca]TYB59686.1 hypothetical protein FXF59_14765 [Microbispora tritici]GLW22399.1 hypothetical protein Mame01_24420 [Microbispora amethystogenes]
MLMSLLVAGLVAVGAVAIIDLLLTVAVIRRLREHSDLLRQTMNSGFSASVVAPVGTEIGAFTATTTTGATIGDGDVASGTVVAFLSAGCEPCRTRLPQFVAYAKNADLRAVAVMMDGDRDDPRFQEMLSALESVGEVIVEEFGKPVWQAFRVQGTPAFVATGNGRIVSTDLPGAPDPVLA